MPKHMDEWDKRIEREAKERLERLMLDSSFAIQYEGVQAAQRWADYQKQVLRDLEATLQPQRDQTNNANWAVKEQLGKLYGIAPLEISIGGWDCKYSPIGRCFYNNARDHWHDICIVCHEPSERK